MKDRKRLRREDSARTSPVRNFTNLYLGAKFTNGASHTKPVVSEKTKQAPTGPLAEGVERAYSVIDKYIAEGRQTAERLNTGPYTTRVARDNAQDLLERMLRLQTEILPLWIDTLAGLVTVQPSQNGHTATPGARLQSNDNKDSNHGQVPIEVDSRRPVLISVDLTTNGEAQSLVALSVNSVDSAKPALTDVKLVPDEVRRGLKLLVRIPDSQPSGTYTGVIVDRNSGDLRGTLNIRIAG